MLDSAVVSASTNSQSSAVDQLDKASIDLRWSASTLVATASVQVKNGDHADWRDLDFGSTITISGASGAHELLLNEMPFTDLRLALTVTSGSGTVSAILTSKSLGA
jgi:hypothetical protein